MLTHQHVRRLFDYDPLTGVLTWRIRAARNVFAGDRAGNQHRQVRINRHAYLMTHVIWCWMTGVWPSTTIDHADTNPTNNTWNNLREATRSEQGFNRRNYGKLLKWVGTNNRGKPYRAQVQLNGVTHYVGSFDTEQDAHDAAYAVAQQLHGPFVRR